MTAGFVDPVRIGILGAAKIAPRVVVEPAATRGDVIVQAVAARDRSRAERFASMHNIGCVAEDYEALVSRDDIDLVYIALPIGAHAEWTERALSHGKAVLCEKSLALDAQQARTMVDAAKSAGLPLIEAFHYRFHAIIARALFIIESGELGTVESAEASFHYPIPKSRDEIRWRPDQGGGVLGDLGCYPVHALRTLLGTEPDLEAAQVHIEDGVDAACSAKLRFGSVPATISTSMIDETPAASLAIRGSEGTLRIDNYIAPQAGFHFEVQRGDMVRDELLEAPPTYTAQMDHVIDVMRGRAAPLTGGTDAIANLMVLDAIRAWR